MKYNFSKILYLIIGLGLLLALTPLVLTPAYSKTKPIQNILILHSYHQGFQWTDSITKGIESELFDISEQIDLQIEYLDTKRFAGGDYFDRFVKFSQYKSTLNKTEFTLIICSDNKALQFIVDYGDKLYPDVPVVFCGINNFAPEILKGKKDVTGVVESIDYEATLNLIHRIHPDRQNILVILDKTRTGVAIKAEFRQVLPLFEKKLTFEYYQDFLLDDVSDKISRLGKTDLIYILTFNRDRSGKFISYTDGIRMIRDVSKVPIYGSWDFYLGGGIVGGMITSGESQGREAARIAKQILSGKSAGDIAIRTKSPNQYMFDYRQMEAFNIKKSQLPENSIIVNNPIGLYAQYKRQILIVSSFIFLIIFTLIWRLVVNHRRQARLKIMNIELDRRVEEQTSKLKLKNDLLSAEIAERIKLEKEIRKLASIDSLTGTNNRRSFMEKATDECLRSQRYKNALSVLMLDIDHFKNINDTYGHHIGDVSLQTFTNVCQDTLRNNDILGRIGGEEFAVILVETGKDEAFQVADRLRAAMAQTIIKEGSVSIQIQVSIGVSQLSSEDANLEDTILRADKALYMAKNQGRNRVICI